MSDCIFCKIAAKEIPSEIIFENEHVLAFMDIRPVLTGHALIIPKRHCRDIFDTAPEILAEVAKIIPKVARAILNVTGDPAFNVCVNTGAEAGQIIFHNHWHIIPRHDGDGLVHWPHQENVSAEELKSLAEKIRAEI